jgi:hypothetical protein
VALRPERLSTVSERTVVRRASDTFRCEELRTLNRVHGSETARREWKGGREERGRGRRGQQGATVTATDGIAGQCVARAPRAGMWQELRALSQQAFTHMRQPVYVRIRCSIPGFARSGPRFKCRRTDVPHALLLSSRGDLLGRSRGSGRRHGAGGIRSLRLPAHERAGSDARGAGEDGRRHGSDDGCRKNRSREQSRACAPGSKRRAAALTPGWRGSAVEALLGMSNDKQRE